MVVVLLHLNLWVFSDFHASVPKGFPPPAQNPETANQLDCTTDPTSVAVRYEHICNPKHWFPQVNDADVFCAVSQLFTVAICACNR